MCEVALKVEHVIVPKFEDKAAVNYPHAGTEVEDEASLCSRLDSLAVSDGW